MSRAADEVWERVAQTLAQEMAPGSVASDMGPLPVWLSAEDIAEAAAGGVELDTGATLASLRDLSEMRYLRDVGLTVAWSSRLWRVNDALGERVVGVRAKRVGDRERAAGVDARLRLEVSAPWWLCASPLARERACHAALMGWAWDRERVVRHLPDIAAHSATLGRFGATDEREVQAIAHAAAHPLTLLDGPNGQLIWQPTQRAVAAAAERMAAAREEEEPAPAPAPRRRRRPAAEA